MSIRKLTCPNCGSKNFSFSFGHVACEAYNISAKGPDSLEVVEYVLDFAQCLDCGAEFDEYNDIIKELAKHFYLSIKFRR